MPVRQQEGKVPSKKKDPPTSGRGNHTKTEQPGEDATEEAQPKKKTWADVAMGKPKPVVASSSTPTAPASTSITSKSGNAKSASEGQRRSGKNTGRSGNKNKEPGSTRGHRKVFTPSKQQGVADKPKLQTRAAAKKPVSMSEARLENLCSKVCADVMPHEQWTGAKLFPLAAVDLPLNQQQAQEPQEPCDYLSLGYMQRSSSSDESTISLPGPLVRDRWFPDNVPSTVHTWDVQASSVTEWNPWLSTYNALPDILTLNNIPQYPDFSPTFQNHYMDMTAMHQSRKFQGSGGGSLPDLTSSTSPVGQKTNVITAKPAIFVTPIRLINFASLHIQFSVQVFNIPRSVPVTHVMLEAIAETPSGLQIPGQIKAESNKRCLEVFSGSFRATHEVGLYNLRVRLILPFKLHLKRRNIMPPSGMGVIGDSVNILVSRNYFRESQHIPSISIRLHLDVQEKLPDGRPITNSKAWGLACDQETNRIYYSERAGHRVSCLDPLTGTILFRLRHTMAGGPLNRPCGLCCDKVNRRVIVCDKDNHRISFFSMDGEYISSFGAYGYHNGMFSFPWDVDIDPFGTRIVVADSRNKRVQLFDQYGNFLAKYSIFETNPFEYKTTFDYPRGISFNLDGTLIYVSDFNTQNVVELPVHFNSCRRLCPEGKLRRPQGIVVDQIGGVLVADSRNNCLRHVSQEGKLLSSIRSVGIHPLVYPVNLTLLRNGYVAVLDVTGKLHLF